MNKIKIEGDNAIITINGKVKYFPILWDDTVPVIEHAWVGVRLGKSGKKIWLSKLNITKGKKGWTVSANSPLNSINGGLVSVTIVDWWDEVPDNLKSNR